MKPKKITKYFSHQEHQGHQDHQDWIGISLRRLCVAIILVYASGGLVATYYTSYEFLI
jgi:hypothetical protein